MGRCIFWNFSNDCTYIWDENTPPSDRPFIDPLLISDSSDWFWVRQRMGCSIVLGFTLGFSCMLGDMTGSYVKRRQGLKREGKLAPKHRF